MNYAIYLRKSRQDEELENDEETLARHKRILLELAQKQQLNIVRIYQEVVSGESIAGRPQIQLLLKDVENGLYKGVLVVEIERLARGNTKDQGIIAEVFSYSNTLIITPNKTYDPNNDLDQEYFEFGLFMSRREYKTINRRLDRGRHESIKEGKFIGNITPYGYDRAKIPKEKGFKLIINPKEAEIVKKIYQWYVDDDLGASLIARKLNQMHVPTRNNSTWNNRTINGILTNPVNMGKIRFGYRKNVRTTKDGIIYNSRPRNPEPEIYNGLHEPIIDEGRFYKACNKVKSKKHPTFGDAKEIKTPLAGLVYCSECGHKMVRRPYNRNQEPSLICIRYGCHNVSSKLSLVEEMVFSALQQYYTEIKAQWDLGTLPKNDAEFEKKQLKNIDTEIEKLQKQLSNTFDLLEQGIYNTETFINRQKTIGENIAQLESDKAKLTQEIDKKQKEDYNYFIPKCHNVLEAYKKTNSPAEQNELLKSVIEKVVYKKDNKILKKDANPYDFKITIYPKINRDLL